MSAGPGTSSTVTIELPEGFPTKIAGTPEAFAREFRLAAAIEWYREGRISQERAAMFAGLGDSEFIEAMGQAKVNVIHEEVALDDVEQAGRADGDLTGERAEDAERHYTAMRSWKQAEQSSAARRGRSGSRVARQGPGGSPRRLRGESQIEGGSTRRYQP